MPTNKCKIVWFEFPIPSLFTTVGVLFHDDWKVEHDRKYPSLVSQGKKDAAVVFQAMDTHLLIDMYLPTKCTPQLISHEAFHVVSQLSSYIGDRIGEHDERWAYLLQYVMDECLDIQKKVRRNATKKGKPKRRGRK